MHREPAFPAKLPRYIVRVLARGLRVDPAERFASMTDVIAALTTEPARRRRAVVVGCAIATLAVSSGHRLCKRNNEVRKIVSIVQPMRTKILYLVTKGY